MEEKVSIIVPCFNHEKYIPDFIDGLIAQTYPKIELLICDDCSSDLSYEMFCKEKDRLEKRFEKVLIVRNKVNCGITITANRLIKEATGKYIKLLASDDILLPEYIEQAVKKFQDDESIDVIVTNGITVDDSFNYKEKCELSSEKSVDISADRLVYDKNPDFSGDLFERLYYGNYIFAPGMICKAYLFSECGLYDEDLQIEDWDYVLRLSQKGKKFYYLDTPLVYYRKSNNSMTSLSRNPNLEKRRISIFISELKTLEKYGKYLEYKKYIDRRVRYLSNMESYAHRNGLFQLLKLVKEQSQYKYRDIKAMGLMPFCIVRIKTHLKKIYYVLRYK